MGFEQEALDELIEHMRGRGAAMQERLTHSTKGEPLVLHELAVHGTRTPSQLAAAADATSGRISAVLASLEKKGFITRTTDPNDRRVTLVNMTDAGRAADQRNFEVLCSTVWVFSQMGEEHTRQLVDRMNEFATYLSRRGRTVPVPPRSRSTRPSGHRPKASSPPAGAPAAPSRIGPAQDAFPHHPGCQRPEGTLEVAVLEVFVQQTVAAEQHEPHQARYTRTARVVGQEQGGVHEHEERDGDGVRDPPRGHDEPVGGEVRGLAVFSRCATIVRM